MLLKTFAAVNIKAEMIFYWNSAKHTCSYPEWTHHPENFLLHLLAQTCGLQYQTALSFMSSLRNNLYMKKIYHYVFSNLSKISNY